jgi:Arc/MetJ-type ribon-helix-helix transcriptional regulator
MAVKLTPHVEEWIERLVDSGQFADANQVIEAALLSLEPDVPLDWAWIAEQDTMADESVAAGRTRPFDDKFADQLRALVTRPR